MSLGNHQAHFFTFRAILVDRSQLPSIQLQGLAYTDTQICSFTYLYAQSFKVLLVLCSCVG